MLHAVDGVSLSLEAGEVLGIVGESGSGKSVAMMALMGLVPFPGRVHAERLRFDGHDLLDLPPRQRNRLVGKDVAMIFQDPTTSLNPCFTVGFQLAETLKLHLKLDGRAARQRSIELLEQVGIPAPATRLAAFPHQLSGGMSQRVMIAMAIACNPKLLIADEPTTALDVTIQAQILDLLRSLQRERGMALVLITPQHGRGGGDGAARDRDVRRPGGRGAGRAATVQRAAPPLRAGAAGRAARAQRRRRPPGHHRRHGAGAARPARRLPVRAALRLRRCPLPCRAARLRELPGGRVRCHYPLGDAAAVAAQAEVAS